MSRRLVISGIAAAALAGAVVPSFASIGSPVTVHRGTDSTTVGVTDNGAPVAGVTVYNDGQVCGGIGLQVPVCTPAVGDAIGPIGVADASPHSTRQSLPVQVRHDDQATGVGVGDVGVVIYNDGYVCPIVSTQNWRCYHLPAS